MPTDLHNVKVNRVNENIYINTNGIDSCSVILEKLNNNGVVISYKRIENVTDEDFFESENGEVVFKSGSDFTFEKNGTFKLTKDVTIEKGAKFKIINSTINY